MGIDNEIDRFFNAYASMHMDLMDYEQWCRIYESFERPKWTMKNGEQIALCDMTDEHLENTIALVERKEPNNNWIKILRKQKTYRKLKRKIVDIKSELSKRQVIREKMCY